VAYFLGHPALRISGWDIKLYSLILKCTNNTVIRFVFDVGRCDQLQSCAYDTNDLLVLGDPCPGTTKYLEVVFQCETGASYCKRLYRRFLRFFIQVSFIRMRTNTRLGDRSLSNFGPKTWNSLQAALRQPGLGFAVVKHHLQSYSFNAI